MKRTLMLLLFMFCAARLVGQEEMSDSDSFDREILEERLLEQTIPAENSHYLDETRKRDSSDGCAIRLRSRVETALQQAAGYTDGKYLGSRIHSYQRMMCTVSRNVETGLLFEKDPGEKRINDFTAWHIGVANLGFLSKVVVGDYLVESGQGLALWRGSDYTKGPEIVKPVSRQGRVIVPYLSSNEQNFLSGIAATASFGSIRSSVFWSRKELSSGLDSAGGVRSFYTTGIYNTETEITHRENVREYLFGSRIEILNQKRFLVGLLWFDSHFTRNLSLTTPRLTGDRFSVISCDVDISISPIKVLSEWTFSNHTDGFIASLITAPAGNVRWVMTYRYYPANLFSLHGLGFGDGTTTSNEQGIYLGFSVDVRKKIQLRMYFDQHSNLEPTVRMYFPQRARELLLSAEFFAFRHASLGLRFEQKESETRSSSTALPPGMIYDRQIRNHYRIDFHEEVSDRIRLGGQYEALSLTNRLMRSSESGDFLLGDILWRPEKFITMNFRLMIFRTDSYVSRLTEFERSLDGTLSIPMFYGKGVKWYVLVTYQVSDRVACQLRYADLLRDDVRRIGTGPDELPGNHDNRIGLQMDVRL